VKFVTDFPITPTGKVQKFVLKEQATKEMGLDKQ
jgi:acyl-CoA synthetase (AMP-forming)/AMP-acid ligase II